MDPRQGLGSWIHMEVPEARGPKQGPQRSMIRLKDPFGNPVDHRGYHGIGRHSYMAESLPKGSLPRLGLGRLPLGRL